MTNTITDTNFDEIIATHPLVVLDFWAVWCEPCHSLSQAITKTASEFPEVFFGKIDVDAQPILAKDFHIQSVPTIVIIRDSVAIFHQAGAIPTAALRDLIQQAQAVCPL